MRNRRACVAAHGEFTRRHLRYSRLQHGRLCHATHHSRTRHRGADARGWAMRAGSKGHKVVAALSLEYLSDAARAGATSLLGGSTTNTSTPRCAAEPDPQRRPQSQAVALSSTSRTTRQATTPARDCKNAELRDRPHRSVRQAGPPTRKLSKVKRAEALKFVIHFVGDIRQPLHGAEDDDDQGGNLVFVTVDDITDKLHSVWDTLLVNKLGGSRRNRREPREPHLRGRREEVQQRNADRPRPRNRTRSRATSIYAQSKGQGARRGQSGRAAERLCGEGAADRALAALALASVRLAMALNKAFESRREPKPKGESSLVVTSFLGTSSARSRRSGSRRCPRP